MRSKRCTQGLPAAVGLLILIFDSRLALEAARSGIDLCIRNVIPALFPFFVLSAVLTGALAEGSIRLPEVINGFLGIPGTAAPVLIPAVFGGYPVGAKCIGDFYRRKQLSRRQAERLLGFCSNAGPSFLFGMVASFFPDQKTVWLLWLIHLLSAALTAAAIPPVETQRQQQTAENGAGSQDPLLSSARAMVCVCCWVVLLRVVIAFLERWFLWMLPVWVQVFCMGILELTNGCCELLRVEDAGLRFVLCSCMLSFGGVCVLLQTASVTEGLPLGGYVKGKLLQTVFSFLLSCAFVKKQVPAILVLIPFLLILFRKVQNKCSNPRLYPV